MSKRRNNDFQKYFKNNRVSPEKHIDNVLVKLEKLDKEEFDFWKEYQEFLKAEREKRISEIQSALEQSQKNGFKRTMSRIVDGAYSDDPLCVYGSIIEPGRFNFGALPSYYSSFGALYLASNQTTAFAERFHHDQNAKIGEGALTPEELSLNVVSHLYSRVEVDIGTYLDLREDDALISFLDAVKDIQPTADLKAQWKAICIKKRQPEAAEIMTVVSPQNLRELIFDPNFKQWISWLDCPSHSQWFGHYAMTCGIQGIIFPSVRAAEGFNLAVFPENFKSTTSLVKLSDKIASVPSDRQEINSSNYLWFSKPNAKISILN